MWRGFIRLWTSFLWACSGRIFKSHCYTTTISTLILHSRLCLVKSNNLLRPSRQSITHTHVSRASITLLLHEPRPGRPNHPPARRVDFDAFASQQPDLFPTMFARDAPPIATMTIRRCQRALALETRDRLLGRVAGKGIRYNKKEGRSPKTYVYVY